MTQLGLCESRVPQNPYDVFPIEKAQRHKRFSNLDPDNWWVSLLVPHYWDKKGTPTDPNQPLTEGLTGGS